MGLLKKILSATREHKIILSLVLVFLILIPAGLIQFNNFRANREKKLEIFHQQQKEKKADLERTYEEILDEQEKQRAKEEREAQKIAEEVDKNFKPNLPNCSKLENRVNIVILDNNCNYKLVALGETTMAAVFVSEELSSDWSNTAKGLQAKKENKTSLKYINTYLSREAHRHGKTNVSIKFDFFGPYKITESLDTLYYRDNMGKFLDVLSETSEKNKVPEQNYDLVHYIYLSNAFGGGAFPGSHRAFTNSSGLSIGVFIHETLHLFGASDKYNDNDCYSIGRANPFDKSQKPQKLSDIMCSGHEDDIINEITAREIGWPN
jgi:hypothetical protein